MLDETNIGPMATAEQLEMLQEFVDDAINMGGSVVLGGNSNTDS